MFQPQTGRRGSGNPGRKWPDRAVAWDLRREVCVFIHCIQTSPYVRGAMGHSCVDTQCGDIKTSRLWEVKFLRTPLTGIAHVRSMMEFNTIQQHAQNCILLVLILRPVYSLTYISWDVLEQNTYERNYHSSHSYLFPLIHPKKCKLLKFKILLYTERRMFS